jgi:hypothetical protein
MDYVGWKGLSGLERTESLEITDRFEGYWLGLERTDRLGNYRQIWKGLTRIKHGCQSLNAQKLKKMTQAGRNCSMLSCESTMQWFS